MYQSPELSPEKLRSLSGDVQKLVKAADLIYVNDQLPGITRKRKADKTFTYHYNGKRITDKQELLRIRKLVIPPAWENVWICPLHNGHIQVTGHDVRGRKQYRYHPNWNDLRNQSKFSRLLTFGEKLPQLRLQLEHDLSDRTLSERKVLAAVISLMERTYIRIGNSEYEKLYGSYGLTTMKDQHVKISGDSLLFSFKGKKGVSHKISLRNRKLARIVKQCREIPGKELFQYYDPEGKRHSIDSGMVNRYIHECTGDEFTAKDFRTWAGSLNALRAFYELGTAATEAEKKRKVVAALDYVSKQLGNTRTVCKKYYVHPMILDMYDSQSLHDHLKELDNIEKNDKLTGWTKDELVLMKILRCR
jgi:DNA topoisomerase-1